MLGRCLLTRRDRLDQARVVVRDVVDPDPYRPAHQLPGRIWCEEGFEPGWVCRLLPNHSAHASGPKITGIRSWSSAHSSFGLVAMIAKLRTFSPEGERSHRPPYFGPRGWTGRFKGLHSCFGDIGFPVPNQREVGYD